MGKEDFRNLTSKATVTDSFGQVYTTTGDADFIRLIPESCTTAMAVDGTGTASLTFVATQFPVEYLDFRKELPDDTIDKFNNRTSYFNKSGILDYYSQLIQSYIYPNLQLYQKYAPWSIDDNTLKRLVVNDFKSFLGYLGSHTEPIYLFTPPQVIWIMMRNSSNSPWYQVFTGVVGDVTVNEESGSSGNRKITVSCVNLLQFITKINAVTQKMCNVLSAAILNQFSPSERPFLLVYMTTTFADANVTWFDAVAELPWSEVMSRFAFTVNRSFGSLTEENVHEMKKMVKTTTFKQRLDDSVRASTGNKNDSWESSGFGYPTEKDVDNYYTFCKNYAFFRFKVVDDYGHSGSHLLKPANYYENVDISTPAMMSVHDLFEINPDEYNVPCSVIGRLCFNKEYRDLEKTGALASPFKKLVKPLLATFEMPKQMAISTVIRQFATQMMMWIHTDGAGNWIVEVPKWNILPKIPKMESHQSVAPGYSDHDDKYVLCRPFELRSFSETTTPSNLVTYLEVPFGMNLVDLDKNITNLFYTGRDMDTINTLLYGFNSMITEQYFTDIGDLTRLADSEGNLLTDSDGNPIGETFLSKFASRQRQFRNADVFTATTTLSLKPGFQPGRNAIVLHRELMYMVTDVSHSYKSGGDCTTTLTMNQGRPIYRKLSEPWSYFVANFAGKDITFTADPTGATTAAVAISSPSKTGEDSAVEDAYDVPALTIDQLNRLVTTGDYSGYYQCPGMVTTGKKYVVPNPNLMHDIAALATELQRFVTIDSRFGYSNMANFRIKPSSIIRPDGGDHQNGFAIDLRRIIFDADSPDSSSEIRTQVSIDFNSGSDATTQELALVNYSAEFLSGIGYVQSHVYQLSGDKPKVVLWDISNQNDVAKVKEGSDPAHIYHMHVKNNIHPDGSGNG